MYLRLHVQNATINCKLQIYIDNDRIGKNSKIKLSILHFNAQKIISSPHAAPVMTDQPIIVMKDLHCSIVYNRFKFVCLLLFRVSGLVQSISWITLAIH